MYIFEYIYIYVECWLPISVMDLYFGFVPKLLSILWMGGWASILESCFSDPFFSEAALSTFIHLSLGKAGPFTLESHIHVKALKMQGFPNNQMPY